MKAFFFFAGAPAANIEFKFQNAEVASAKVAFDTVRDLPMGYEGGLLTLQFLVYATSLSLDKP